MEYFLQELDTLGLGSRLKRLSDYLMKETQLVYDALAIDFDPYLFPIFKVVIAQEPVTNAEIRESLQYTQPAITQALKKLLHKQLIAIATDKEDKRKKIIRVTPKGHDLHTQMQPLWNVIEHQIKWLTEGGSTSLTRHLTHLENQFREKPLSVRIIENLKEASR